MMRTDVADMAAPARGVSLVPVAAVAAGLATILGFTSWGSRPSWPLLIVTLAGVAATTAADLRRQGALRVRAWPLDDAEFLLTVATCVLLAATAFVDLHVRVGSLLWAGSLVLLCGGVADRLGGSFDVTPARIWHGARGVALGGAVLLLAGLLMEWGHTSSSMLPGYGFGYSCSGGDCGFGFGTSYATPVFVGGFPYPGTSVEYAEWATVAVLAGVAALLGVGQRWRPWWHRLAPAVAAAIAAAWFVLARLTSVLASGGSHSLGWWVALTGVVIFAAGSGRLCTSPHR
jgi:hypothetical protein